jgi:hypothetical protein
MALLLQSVDDLRLVACQLGAHLAQQRRRTHRRRLCAELLAGFAASAFADFSGVCDFNSSADMSFLLLLAQAEAPPSSGNATPVVNPAFGEQR